jgi:hypothetical protein
MCSTKSFRDGKGEVKEFEPGCNKPKTAEELRKLAVAKGIIETAPELDTP